MATFDKGDRVTVSTPVGIDGEFRGRSGSFLEYTKNHGYARVQLDGGSIVLLHPESLTNATKRPRK